ncbi:MAG: hypothetical protein ABI333_30475 [bacterium]
MSPRVRSGCVDLALALALAIVAGAQQGCVFELDMCRADEECGSTSLCSDGLCVERPRVEIVDNIGVDTVWTSDRVWVLKDVITVQPSVTLTIEPGTTILAEQHSALVVRSGGTLDASGTRERPIVFSSISPPGQRLAGDWGGVALLGQAPVNREGAYLRIRPGELEPPFGGTDSEWNCGTLRYVRIEFAGGQIQGTDYLNSLSLCGCGRGTTIDHVQLHFGGDDGLEIFGGTVDVRYIVITRAADEAIDIDLGWVGTGQFIAVQGDAAMQGALEVDNLQEDASALPLTDFQIFNFTFIGSLDAPTQRGITFKAGGGGFFSHGIMMGQGTEAVDIEGDEAGARAFADEAIVRDTVFYRIGAGGAHYFPVAGEPDETGDASGDDDGGFAEDQYYVQPQWNNLFGEDPLLERPYDLSNPGWIPAGSSITGVDPPPAPFDPTANYRGAFAPGSIPWTDGWTAYPES